MGRALVLVNPEAGGDAAGAGERAASILREAGWEATVSSTEMRGHGALLAEEAAAAGTDLCIAAGGDGTAREAAAGVCGTETVFAIAPAGTGNSSYRELFEDEDWEERLRAYLATGAARTVDLNRVEPTGEVSLLGFSVGWFAQVVELAATESATGRARYAAAAQRAAQAPRSFTAKVSLDGAPFMDGDLGLLAVGGARRRGGVFPVLPDSRLDDGELDVLAVRACGPAEFMELLQLVMQARHAESPLVRIGRGRAVDVSSAFFLPAEVDGDLWQLQVAEARVEVMPAALRVIGR